MKEEGEQGNEKVPIFMVVVAGNNNYFFPFLKSQTIYLNHLLMYFFLWGGDRGSCLGVFLDVLSFLAHESGPICLKGKSLGKLWVSKLNFYKNQ